MKKEERLLPLLIAALIGIIILLIILYTWEQENAQLKSQLNNTYEHSETKAFCNSTGFCRDYEIYYRNNSVIAINPTNYTLQLPEK